MQKDKKKCFKSVQEYISHLKLSNDQSEKSNYSKFQKGVSKTLKEGYGMDRKQHQMQAKRNANKLRNIQSFSKFCKAPLSFMSAKQGPRNSSTSQVNIQPIPLLNFKKKSEYQNLTLSPQKVYESSARKSLGEKQAKTYYHQKSQVHYGYICDICEIQPIVGVRYHCSDSACQDDYDLCGKCYKQKSHIHKMEKIEDNGLWKAVSHIVGTPEKKNRSTANLNEEEES